MILARLAVLGFDAAGWGAMLAGVAAVLALLNRRVARRAVLELRRNGGDSFADEVFTRLERIESTQRTAEARTMMRHRANERRLHGLEQGQARQDARLEVIENELAELGPEEGDT